jgi:Cu/Ag efflux protein CusF
MKQLNKLVVAAVLGLSGGALAPMALAQQAAQQAMATLESMSEGEVRKVDKVAGKLTIKHGELKNLSMPAMTMVFRVKDPSMLDKVKPGDKVRFVAEQVGGALTVTAIEPAK